MNVSDYSWPLADPHIVARNRQGQFTPQQQSALNLYTTSPYWGWPIAAFLLAITLSPFYYAFQEGAPAMVWPFYIPIFGGMSLLIIGGTAVQTRRSQRTRQEIKRGPIAHAPGRVTWNGRQYVATVPGKQLKGALGKIDLLPGEYHFYFLPYSGFLLSAEPVAVDRAQGQAQLSQNLARTFGSKSGDLPLNRLGRLSSRQRLRLLWTSAGYGLGIIVTILSTIGLFLANLAQNRPASPWFAGFCLLIGLTFVVYLVSSSAARLTDALTGECHTVTGRIEVVSRTAGRSATMHYVIQGMEFDVPHKAYFSVVQGIRYHLYYAPRSKVIAGIEPVGQSSTP